MIRLIGIEQIVSGTNIRNERDEEIQELAKSIDRDGLLQPITVRPVAGGKYEIIAGHRRFEAIKLNNEPYIECNVLEGITDAERLRLQVIENVQRKNMSAYELTEIFEKLDAAGYTDCAIAKLFNKSTGWVYQQREAKKILEREYKEGIPEEAKKLSYSAVKKEANKRIKKAPELIECKGMRIKKEGHTYNVYCIDYDAEQELNALFNKRKI